MFFGGFKATYKYIELLLQYILSHSKGQSVQFFIVANRNNFFSEIVAMPGFIGKRSVS